MKPSFQFSVKNDLVTVNSKVEQNLSAVSETLREKSIEWIQEKILYGYHDPHGPDGHTEIVDTGATFESTDARIKRDSQNTFTISAGVTPSYAVFVHNGTRKLKGRPFVRDAMIEHTNTVKDILESGVGNGMD